MITPAFKNDLIMVFRCEDLFYPQYEGKFFVLEKSQGYGYFYPMIQAFTKGELLDKFNITLS
jgi:hypothetical protein